MALKTKCQTPDTQFGTRICSGADRTLIDIALKLPIRLDLSDEEAETLEANIHNALELVLARYFITPDSRTAARRSNADHEHPRPKDR